VVVQNFLEFPLTFSSEETYAAFTPDRPTCTCIARIQVVSSLVSVSRTLFRTCIRRHVFGYKLLVRDTCVRLHVSGVYAAFDDRNLTRDVRE